MAQGYRLRMKERNLFNGCTLPQSILNASSSLGICAVNEEALQDMFDHAKNTLFHRRTVMGSAVRTQDGLAILHIPVVTMDKHFII